MTDRGPTARASGADSSLLMAGQVGGMEFLRTQMDNLQWEPRCREHPCGLRDGTEESNRGRGRDERTCTSVRTETWGERQGGRGRRTPCRGGGGDVERASCGGTSVSRDRTTVERRGVGSGAIVRGVGVRASGAGAGVPDEQEERSDNGRGDRSATKGAT